MFLAVDIGNSRIKCGLFEGDTLVSTIDMRSDPTASVAAYRHSLRSRLGELTPTAAGVSSVVPTMTDMIVQAIRDDFMVLASVVGPDLDPPFEIDYVPPESLGADRLCAAAAAFRKYAQDDAGQNRPLVVVDAGTTITYEVVVDGVYKGGAILPGPTLSADALARGTGKLPLITASTPRKAVGKSTTDAIRSGIMFGFVDSVTGMIARLESELRTTPFVVSTGGAGEFLEKRIDAVDVYEPHLVLEGIAFMVRRSGSG